MTNALLHLPDSHPDIADRNQNVLRFDYEHVALKSGVTNGSLFPVTCGVATKNLATNRLLDALVEDMPSPVKKGAFHAGDRDIAAEDEGDTIAFVFKTLADPFAGKINLMRVYHGVVSADTQLFNCRAHVKERMGQLLVPQGKEHDPDGDYVRRWVPELASVAGAASSGGCATSATRPYGPRNIGTERTSAQRALASPESCPNHHGELAASPIKSGRRRRRPLKASAIASRVTSSKAR